MNIKTILLYFSIITFLFGCKKPDFDKIAGGVWNPKLAVPIGYSEFSVADILAKNDPSNLITTSELGALSLAYSDSIGSFEASKILNLTDQSVSYSLPFADLNIPVSGNLPGGVVFSSSSGTTLPFDFPNGETLYEINLEGGDLNISLNTSLKHDVTFELTFPDIKKNGVVLQKTIVANYFGTSPHSVTATIDLSNTILDLTAGGSSTNTIRVNLATTITGTGNPISNSETNEFNFEFQNLKFLNATGYFGQQDIAADSDSIIFEIFKNTTNQGFVQLSNPKLKFFVKNSFGIPIMLDINDLSTTNTNTGVVTTYTNSDLANIVISAPSTMGMATTTDIPEINTSNTANLNSLVNTTPKYLNFAIHAVTNPNGQPTTPNFITKDSRMTVYAALELPLEGYAYNVNLSDTLPFNFAETGDAIESVMFRLNATNGLPIGFNAQVTFVDENFNPLCTLFENQEVVIIPAPVDLNGTVTKPINKITDVTLPRTKLSMLNQTKHIIISGRIASTDPQGTNVKIFEHYRFSLKLALQLNYNGKV